MELCIFSTTVVIYNQLYFDVDIDYSVENGIITITPQEVDISNLNVKQTSRLLKLLNFLRVETKDYFINPVVILEKSLYFQIKIKQGNFLTLSNVLEITNKLNKVMFPIVNLI